MIYAKVLSLSIFHPPKYFARDASKANWWTRLHHFARNFLIGPVTDLSIYQPSDIGYLLSSLCFPPGILANSGNVPLRIRDLY